MVRTVESMIDRVRVERRSPDDESVARVRLEAERSRMAGLIVGLEREGLDRESEADSIGAVASSSQHEADVGSETFERERDLSLLAEFRDELSEIQPALARVAHGSYGACMGCHEPIDSDRLEAVPATRYCKACQDRYELSGALTAEPVTVGVGMVIDVTEFLPDDDELGDQGPAPTEAAAGAEEEAVFTYGEADLGEAELRDELDAEGVEDGRRDGRAGTELDEQDTLAPETSDAEEASLEALRDEELVEENRQTEELEGDLIVAIRRQLGLDDEVDLDDTPAAPADYEELPRPRQSDEFLCSTCFQLKRRTQLADPIRSRCVDCVIDGAD
jgi:RNA polymerase-binding transcription factor DksA